MLMADTALIESATQFGVAGLMGALWVWERLYSRRREHELSQAHRLLIRREQELKVLVEIAQHNTAAIERFEKTQARLAESIEQLAVNRRVA